MKELEKKNANPPTGINGSLHLWKTAKVREVSEEGIYWQEYHPSDFFMFVECQKELIVRQGDVTHPDEVDKEATPFTSSSSSSSFPFEINGPWVSWGWRCARTNTRWTANSRRAYLLVSAPCDILNKTCAVREGRRRPRGRRVDSSCDHFWCGIMNYLAPG